MPWSQLRRAGSWIAARLSWWTTHPRSTATPMPLHLFITLIQNHEAQAFSDRALPPREYDLTPLQRAPRLIKLGRVGSAREETRRAGFPQPRISGRRPAFVVSNGDLVMGGLVSGGGGEPNFSTCHQPSVNPSSTMDTLSRQYKCTRPSSKEKVMGILPHLIPLKNTT